MIKTTMQPSTNSSMRLLQLQQAGTIARKPDIDLKKAADTPPADAKMTGLFSRNRSATSGPELEGAKV
jgi:hypothetical protein